MAKTITANNKEDFTTHITELEELGYIVINAGIAQFGWWAILVKRRL